MAYPYEQQERINKVKSAVEQLKSIAGVSDAFVDDHDMHAYGFNVDVIIQAEADRYYTHWRTNRCYKISCNLRSVVAKCNGILHRAGLRSRMIQPLKKIYREYDKKPIGYEDNRMRFDVYA